MKLCILSTAREWKNYCAVHAGESCRESAHLFQLLELYFHLSFSNISWSSRDQQPKLTQSQQGNQRPRQFDSLWDPLRPAWIEIMSGFIQGLTLVNRPSCSVPSGFLGTSFCAPSVLSLVNLRFHLQWEWNQSSSGWQSWKRYDKVQKILQVQSSKQTRGLKQASLTAKKKFIEQADSLASFPIPLMFAWCMMHPNKFIGNPMAKPWNSAESLVSETYSPCNHQSLDCFVAGRFSYSGTDFCTIDAVAVAKSAPCSMLMFQVMAYSRLSGTEWSLV